MLPEEQSEGRTPDAAKKLSIGLVVWIFVGALAILALYAFLKA